MLKIKNLSYSYKKDKVLKEIDIDTNSNRIGIFGQNGAGKTTLLKCISTLVQLQEGDVFLHKNYSVNNNNIQADINNIRKIIGYFPQKITVNLNLRSIDLLKYMLWAKKISKPISDCQPLIDKFKINGFLNKKLSHLSGGELRLVYIVFTLCTDAKVLIFDEPTVGLDIQNRSNFISTLKKIDPSITIIITSHISSDIVDLCEEIFILHNNTIAYSGTIENLLQKENVSNLDQALLKIYER